MLAERQVLKDEMLSGVQGCSQGGEEERQIDNQCGASTDMCCPNAGPTGGAGFAAPAGQYSFNTALIFLTFFAMTLEALHLPEF